MKFTAKGSGGPPGGVLRESGASGGSLPRLPTPTRISPDDLDWLAETLLHVPFHFAKTMPSVPHYYSHKWKDWPSPEDYVQAGLLILHHGTPEKLWSFPVRRYLYVGPWRYWLMTTDITESFIMNRCDPTHPRYRGAIRPAVEG